MSTVNQASFLFYLWYMKHQWSTFEPIGTLLSFISYAIYNFLTVSVMMFPVSEILEKRLSCTDSNNDNYTKYMMGVS